MNNPLVSIIIPTYNRAHLIAETLDSVLAQTYENWECIIVDDGSTDNTDEVLGSYVTKDTRFQYHHRPNSRPKGANACRNYGFEMSRGEYINWFDDDDIMLKDFLKIKIDSINPSICLIICSGYFVDKNLMNKKSIELDEGAYLFKDYSLWSLKILTPSVLFRKSFLESKILFNCELSRGQETELFSRIFFKLPEDKYKIINSQQFLYRQHDDSKTFRNESYVRQYKESLAYIAIHNLKRSIEIYDVDLINANYRNLIDLFFRGIENGHKDNCNYILKNLISLLRKNKNISKIELFLVGNLFCLCSRGSYRFEKRWKMALI